MRAGLTLALVRYITNHVIARVPLYAVRHAWYRRVLGMQIGEGSALLMDLLYTSEGACGPAGPALRSDAAA